MKLGKEFEMKKLLVILALLFSFSLVGCSNNAEENNYENTDEKNIEEDVFEDQMGDPEIIEGFILQFPQV